jgi:hypothetical protein
MGLHQFSTSSARCYWRVRIVGLRTVSRPTVKAKQWVVLASLSNVERRLRYLPALISAALRAQCASFSSMVVELGSVTINDKTMTVKARAKAVRDTPCSERVSGFILLNTISFHTRCMPHREPVILKIGHVVTDEYRLRAVFCRREQGSLAVVVRDGG